MKGMNEATKLEWGTSIDEYSIHKDRYTGYLCPGCGRAGMRVVEEKDGVSRWYCEACEDNTYVPSRAAYEIAFAPAWQRMTPSDVYALIGDDPVDTSPLSDPELDLLEAWLRLSAAVQETGRKDWPRLTATGPEIHPAEDIGLLYRAVHELKQRRADASGAAS